MCSPMSAGETVSDKAVCVQSVSQPWSTFERVVKGHLVSGPHSPSSRAGARPSAGLRACRVEEGYPPASAGAGESRARVQLSFVHPADDHALAPRLSQRQTHPTLSADVFARQACFAAATASSSTWMARSRASAFFRLMLMDFGAWTMARSIVSSVAVVILRPGALNSVGPFVG